MHERNQLPVMEGWKDFVTYVTKMCIKCVRVYCFRVYIHTDF